MKEVIFVNSHPIQYFVPLYKYLNDEGIGTEAWYGSDESIKGGLDKQFGIEVKWDIPLLQGYKYKFFKNYSRKPSHFNGFFGLMNFGMIKELFKRPKSVIIVHGWHYMSHLLILLLGKLNGHTICLRCEMPYNQESLKTGWKQRLKRVGLKYLLFPRVDYFMNIGTQNKLFYKSYGIPDDRIVFCPYSVDNHRFRMEKNLLQDQLSDIKASIGVKENEKVILYAGKYMSKKNPLDLLKAYIRLNKSDCWLIMVGEGEQRAELESLIKEKQLTKVVLTGFINQSQIANYYAISDVFVMCSGIGETWGLSVNEAMNFNLPIVVSDLTGCSIDLVKEGVNGYRFETGNIDELELKLASVLYDNQLSMEVSSEDIVDIYSYNTIAQNLLSLTR